MQARHLFSRVLRTHHYGPPFSPYQTSRIPALRTIPPCHFLSATTSSTLPLHTPPADNTFVPSLSLSIPGHCSTVDPFTLVSSDLAQLTQSIRSTVSVLQHPILDEAASHLLSLQGKRLRPLMVILMAHATALTATVPSAPTLLPNQLRLAEITELIHAASLLHDDVIDVADTRRGALSVNSLFGNQLAVLAGDFLLARASVALARLRDCDVVELLSTVIEHLVRGEVIQMRGGLGFEDVLGGGIGDVSEEERRERPAYHAPRTVFERYMAKTFFKTASLVANSCRAVTMLAGHGGTVAEMAYVYGENIGIGFQLVDDLLDMTGREERVGKPVLNDLKQGIATAPVLFAMQEFGEIEEMMRRKFRENGDVERVVELVERADGVEKTRDLAREHVRRAVEVIVGVLPASEYRSALVNLGEFVLSRDR